MSNNDNKVDISCLAGKDILVTGGAGYIGSHAVKALLGTGCKVTILDNLERGHKATVDVLTSESDQCSFVKADLRDADSIEAVFAGKSFSGAIHFAAFALVGESVADPELYYRNNVIGTLNLLAACKNHGVKNIVFSSTCATIGVPAEVPIPETHTRAPINPYGKTKSHIEDALAAYSESYDMNYLAFRYFNAAGADPSGVIGEDHDPETHLIPNVFRNLLGQLDEFTLHGKDYPTPDGTCIRDYIHVYDLAKAHVIGLAYLYGGGSSDVINLGTGKGYSVLEILNACEKVTGLKTKLKEGPRRPGDPPELVAKIGKANNILGFTPERSDLETIVGDAWSWHKSHPNGYEK